MSVREETFSTGCQHEGVHHSDWIYCTETGCDVCHCWKDIADYFALDEHDDIAYYNALSTSNNIFKCITHGFKNMPIDFLLPSHEDEAWEPTEDTASSHQSNKLSNNKQKKRRGRPGWEEKEEQLFLEGLEKYGRNWKKIVTHMGGTRTRAVVTSHAQNYFLRLLKARKELPKKVKETGVGYTTSGRLFNKYSRTAETLFGHPDNVPDMDGVISDQESGNASKQYCKKRTSRIQPTNNNPIQTFALDDTFQDGKQCEVIGIDNNSLNSGQIKVENTENINNNSLQLQRKRKRRNINVGVVNLISSEDESDEIEIETLQPKKKRKINGNEPNIKYESNVNEIKMDNGNNGNVNIKTEYYNNNNYMSRPWNEWTTDDIVDWLTELENGKFKGYSCLLRSVKDEEVCGENLDKIEEKHLYGWGVKKFGDKIAIYEQIKKLTGYK